MLKKRSSVVEVFLWVFLLFSVICSFYYKYGTVFLVVSVILNCIWGCSKVFSFNGRALLFLLYYLPFYSIFRLSFIYQGYDFKLFNYLRDIVILMMFCAYLFTHKWKKFTIAKQDSVWVFFLGSWILGVLISGLNGYAILGILGVHYVTLPALLYIIVVYGHFDMTSNFFRDVFIKVALTVAIAGLIVYVDRPAVYCKLFEIAGNTTNPVTYVRFVSTFFTPNVCGSVMAIGVACALSRFLDTKKMRYLAFCTIFLVCAVLTLSRGTWLFLCVLFAIFLIHKPKSGFIVGGVLIIFFVIVMLNANDSLLEVIGNRVLSLFDSSNESSYGRVGTWLQSLELLKTHPFGLGMGASTTAQISQGNLAGVAVIDGFYIKTIVEMGLFGVIFCVCFVLWSLIKCTRNILATKSGNAFWALAICVGVLLQSLASNVFDFICVAPWFWVALGFATREKNEM